MQFIGEWMKAHCIANFTYVFRKTIWNRVKSLDVMLTAGQAWQWLAPIIQYKPYAPNHLLVNMNAFERRGVSKSLGVLQQWSTFPDHAKIDAQELFYFMILPVGGTLIDLAVSMKARLEHYTDGHGTLIFDNYYECSPKNHEKTHRGEVGYHWLQHETTDDTASQRSDHEKQD